MVPLQQPQRSFTQADLQQQLAARQQVQQPITQQQVQQPQPVLQPPRVPQATYPQQPQAMYPQQQMPTYMVDPAQAHMPAFVPQNHVQMGAQVPAYLTVPEPYNGKLLPMVCNSMMRAGLKGMLWTAANMMDHFPWGG
jgi:hypothetical protein